MPGRFWLAQRALLAVILTAGFYLLAFAAATLLFGLAYAQVHYFHHLDRFAGLAVMSAVAILWALVPRRDSFTPPGPRLDEDEQRELFSLVREVATATGQAMPEDVYIINDTNAWVAQRGGVLGVGGRRVMGIGLPLLEALTVVEFRAVIAHEFGHYAGGDVMLGPFIHRTRGAIARTIGNVRLAPVRAIFASYAQVFMKLTLAVSRQQELVADQVAARAVSAEALARALQRIDDVGVLHQIYMAREVGPVLAAGFVPPIAAGFREFMAADDVRTTLLDSARRLRANRVMNPFDTHPPLAERLSALQRLQPSQMPETGGLPASRLVAEIGRFGLRNEDLSKNPALQRLAPIGWDEVAAKVILPRWRRLREQTSLWLSTMTANNLPAGREQLLGSMRKTLDVANRQR